MKIEGKLADETKWTACCCHLTCNVDLSATPTRLFTSERLTNDIIKGTLKSMIAAAQGDLFYSRL
jgi:hypothetical protein